MHTRPIGLTLLALALAVAPALAQPADATKGQSRAYLGLSVEPVREGERGVAVRGVTPDSPAARAGIMPGDVVVKVGDRDVSSPEDLIAAVARHQPGETLTFRVVRQGQETDLSVALGERPAARPPGGEGLGRPRAGGFLGVVAVPLTPAARQRLGVTADRGVAASDVMPDSPAARAGLRRGDVITTVDGQAVADPAALRQAIHQAGPNKEITLAVVRGTEMMEVRARLDELPVDGITLPLVPFQPPAGLGARPPMSGFPSADKVGELERRVNELERRVRELEQKRGPGN
jgi:serine protease Do